MRGRALECVPAVGPLYITATRSVGQGVGGGFMLALGPAVVPAVVPAINWRAMLTPVPLRASCLLVPMVQARHSSEASCASPDTRDSQGEEL